MNNFERIKNMTLDEMARWYKDHIDCSDCDLYDYCPDYKFTTCTETVKQWLQAESEDNQ